MRVLDGLARRLGYAPIRPKAPRLRGFAAGETDRLTWNFGGRGDFWGRLRAKIYWAQIPTNASEHADGYFFWASTQETS